MWLSGLHIPESYLTALVQATCRRNGWPLDRSTLFTQVTKFQDADEVNERAGQGKCRVSWSPFGASLPESFPNRSVIGFRSCLSRAVAYSASSGISESRVSHWRLAVTGRVDVREAQLVCGKWVPGSREFSVRSLASLGFLRGRGVGAREHIG